MAKVGGCKCKICGEENIVYADGRDWKNATSDPVSEAYFACGFHIDTQQGCGNFRITKDPLLPTKCVCDIMALMSQGCKCGFIEAERKLREIGWKPGSLSWLNEIIGG